MTKAYEDIIYTAEAGVATIAVNRPDRLNAYREETYYEVLMPCSVRRGTKTLV